MVFIGSDATILIDSIDYTGSIFEFEEEGGEFTYATIKTVGNNYTKVITGRTGYILSMGFKVLDSNLETLFKNENPIEVSYITSGFTTTYSNLRTASFNLVTEVEDMTSAQITLSATPLDETGTDNRSML